jgi:Ras-associated and pleckstrin homology domains-containing protein 1
LFLQGLETYQQSPVKLRSKEQLSVPKSERINSYRFSMANLEETQESELDSILTELSMLEQKGDLRQSRVQTHSRSSSIVSGVNSTISTSTSSDVNVRESSRTDSPDNDSAFSDTVSLLSSESSASSGLSSLNNNISKIPPQNIVQVSQLKIVTFPLALN